MWSNKVRIQIVVVGVAYAVVKNEIERKNTCYISIIVRFSYLVQYNMATQAYSAITLLKNDKQTKLDPDPDPNLQTLQPHFLP